MSMICQMYLAWLIYLSLDNCICVRVSVPSIFSYLQLFLHHYFVNILLFLGKEVSELICWLGSQFLSTLPATLYKYDILACCLSSPAVYKASELLYCSGHGQKTTSRKVFCLTMLYFKSHLSLSYESQCFWHLYSTLCLLVDVLS